MYPAASHGDDVILLSAAGWRVWSYPTRAVDGLTALRGGYRDHVEREGYDADLATARWYSDGSLVVYAHVRRPGAVDEDARDCGPGCAGCESCS